jgi:hypothetical protein
MRTHILSAGALAVAISLSPISFDQHSLATPNVAFAAGSGGGGFNGGFGRGFGGGGSTNAGRNVGKFRLINLSI